MSSCKDMGIRKLIILGCWEHPKKKERLCCVPNQEKGLRVFMKLGDFRKLSFLFFLSKILESCAFVNSGF